MSRIMITGALGNVGGYAAQYALATNQDVTVADISVDALTKRYGGKARAVRFDFTDPTTFDEALKDVDCVFIMRPPIWASRRICSPSWMR